MITPKPVVDHDDHSAPRKLLNKILRYPLNIYYSQYYKQNPTLPWLSPSSIGWLERNLNSSMTGFEWGSGRSTLYFANRTKDIVSIEHNEDWYTIISSKLKEENINNVDYRFVAEVESDQKPIRNKYWEILEYKINRPSFTHYCEAILEFENHHFDFIVVDGRARVACGLNALDKLKPGGLLIFDNTERAHYSILTSYLVENHWRMLKFPCWISETTILIKPNS